MRNRVVFPAPFGPMTATNSPGRMSNVASFQTSLFRYRTSTRSARTAGTPEPGEPPAEVRNTGGWGSSLSTERQRPSGAALSAFARLSNCPNIQSWKLVSGGWIVSLTYVTVTLCSAASASIVVVIGVTV